MTNEEFQKAILEELSNIKGQLTETNGIVKALMHRTEELDAKFDGLLHTTATKESLATLEIKVDKGFEDILNKIDMVGHDINFLVRRSAQYADDIRDLRRAR